MIEILNQKLIFLTPALSADRLLTNENAAPCANGRNDGPRRSIRDGRWKAALGRTRCCTCNQTWLAVARLNVAGGLIVIAVWGQNLGVSVPDRIHRLGLQKRPKTTPPAILFRIAGGAQHWSEL